MGKRIIIYGPSKIGVSTFLASNKEALFINPGDGIRHLDCKTIQDSTTYGSIITAIEKLLTAEHKYKTLVIDHLVALERIIFNYVCEVNKIEHMDYFNYGKGHQLAFVILQDFLSKLDKLSKVKDMNIYLVGHAIRETYSTLFQENLTRSVLYSTIRPPKENVSDWLKIWSDALLYVDNSIAVQGNYLPKHNSPINLECISIYMQQRPSFEAGNRYGWPFDIPLSWPQFKAEVLFEYEEDA